MNATAFFQLFLLADVFVIGILAAVAGSHALAHFRPQKPTVGTVRTTVTKEPLPAVMRERLLKESQLDFENALHSSTGQLKRHLEATAAELDRLLRGLGIKIIGDELERYRVELSELRKQAEADMGKVREQIGSHQAEIEQQMAAELAAQKQHLLQQIDTKLADAVGTFLMEALQHHVDLGAQEQYLITMLEEHKADFKKEVADDAPIA